MGTHYPSLKPCCICGSKWQIGDEPRFTFAVCEEHSKLSPVEIEQRRNDL